MRGKDGQEIWVLRPDAVVPKSRQAKHAALMPTLFTDSIIRLTGDTGSATPDGTVKIGWRK
jgi:hypothetical protein